MESQNWAFRCYVNEKNINEIKAWVDEKGKKASAKLRRNLEILSGLPKQEWHKPHPASFVDDHIYVIRFVDHNRSQWRIYGFHEDPKKVFVMTNTGREKDNTYEPSVEQSINNALSRMESARSDWEHRTCACIFPTDGATSGVEPSCGQGRLER